MSTSSSPRRNTKQSRRYVFYLNMYYSAYSIIIHSSLYSSGSVFLATQSLNRRVDDSLATLNALWDEVGLTDEARGKRVEAVYAHIHRLIETMVCDCHSFAMGMICVCAIGYRRRGNGGTCA
jgi:hypothetical protein